MSKSIIPQTPKGYISVPDAVKKYGISRHAINSWRHRNLIEQIEYPAKVLIREDEIPAFLRKRGENV